MFPVPVRLKQLSTVAHLGGQAMGLDVALIVARNDKVPAADEEDVSGSPKRPTHAAVSATTISRFMSGQSNTSPEGKSRHGA